MIKNYKKELSRYLLVLAIMMPNLIFAQSKITGLVSAAKGNEIIAGVSVTVKGTSQGTLTDASGKYSISALSNSTLVFSFIGFVKKEVSIGSQSVINVSLSEETTALDEVVVTALGIKKESKKLGYATTTINAEAITENRSPNFMNALQGKIAGVNISALGTGPAGTSKIRIRGQSSFSGQNSPLIVINGVPIDNTNFGTNPGNSASDNSIGYVGVEILRMGVMVCLV